MVHVEVVLICSCSLKQRLELLMGHVNAPARELKETERAINRWKEKVKEREIEANEQERKFNQLQKEGLS